MPPRPETATATAAAQRETITDQRETKTANTTAKAETKRESQIGEPRAKRVMPNAPIDSEDWDHVEVDGFDDYYYGETPVSIAA